MEARGSPDNDDDAFDKVAAFLRRSSTAIKDTSKKTGAKISEGVKEMNLKEKGKKVKRGFLRFATKVKGLFSKKEDQEDEETKGGPKFKKSANVEKDKA